MNSWFTLGLSLEPHIIQSATLAQNRWLFIRLVLWGPQPCRGLGLGSGGGHLDCLPGPFLALLSDSSLWESDRWWWHGCPDWFGTSQAGDGAGRPAGDPDLKGLLSLGRCLWGHWHLWGHWRLVWGMWDSVCFLSIIVLACCIDWILVLLSCPITL